MKIFDKSTRRGEIGSAAVQLFYEKGYHATGIRELTTLLEMTKGNFYNFFLSKEELLNYILETSLKAIINNVKSVVKPDMDPVTQLTAAIHAHIMFHGENQKEALVSDSELRGLQGELLQNIIDSRDKYERIFRDILVKGIKSGAFAHVDPKLTTIAILTMCTQVAYWYRPHGEWNLRDISEKYCDLILSGLRPR